ncbi:hypothetical protein BIV57_21565 [Mangrovactinospora gilvigrisea]|uniref:Uncharacterized protein n=2 Tax=Mangrovactinospora gilvigrisea TaxID=1428644 RepID=A0A1J7C722_9ACTN|nr:hypothetical protein BIV57_21565 [Mangrovactinospora gilvigrisea]
MLTGAGFRVAMPHTTVLTADAVESEAIDHLVRDLLAAGFVADPDRADALTPDQAVDARQQLLDGFVRDLRGLGTRPASPLMVALGSLSQVAEWADSHADSTLGLHADALANAGWSLLEAWQQAFKAALARSEPGVTAVEVGIGLALRDPLLDAASAARQVNDLYVARSSPVFTICERMQYMATVARAGLGEDDADLAAVLARSAERVLAVPDGLNRVADHITAPPASSAARGRSGVPHDPDADPADPSVSPRPDDGPPPHSRHR